MCLRQDKEGVNRDFFLEPIFPTVIFTSKLKLFSDKHFSSIFSPKQKAGGRRKKFKYWNVMLLNDSLERVTKNHWSSPESLRGYVVFFIILERKYWIHFKFELAINIKIVSLNIVETIKWLGFKIEIVPE